MKQGKVSIVMPVYNCEKYLKQTINSIKNQTYKNFELIIVDDVSTDSSLKVIEEETKEIRQKTKIIKLEKNSGVAHARNVGVENSIGQYVAYIDADDMWDKNKLKKQVKFMKKNKSAFSFTSYYFLRKGKVRKVRKIPNSQNYNQAIKDNIIFTSTVMIDVSIVDKRLLKMPNIKRGQDAATWWQILKEGYIAHGLNENLTFYRVGNISLSSNKLKAMKRTWILYKKVEKFNYIKSFYYLIWHAYYASKKRLLAKRVNLNVENI